MTQNKKQKIDSTFERIEKIQKLTLRKLGILLTKEKAAKIAIDSFLNEARQIEAVAKKYRSQVKQDSAFNEASKLYNLAESISKSFSI